MRTRLFTFAFVIGFTSIIACSAGKGEDCEDDGVIGGDCEEGLICGRSKADDETSGLVCMKPCAEQGQCADNETCSGDRGRIVMACRPR